LLAGDDTVFGGKGDDSADLGAFERQLPLGSG
jgi:hypothetical protein